ncbi:hypothetical protein FACS1894105_07450 [Clostridia bacterium]|nr:hypothetical protein FACS1894105_07450 [Clostridia bacterium]
MSSGYWDGPDDDKVYNNSKVEISGGTVAATGDTYSGILADYVTIEDGAVTAVGKWYGIVSYFAENQDEDVPLSDYLGSVTISGGNVTATGTNTPSAGILAGEEIAISGTDTVVTASGTYGELSAEQIYSLFYIEEEEIDEDIYLGGAFDILAMQMLPFWQAVNTATPLRPPLTAKQVPRSVITRLWATPLTNM